jgi:hypothetical protein
MTTRIAALTAALALTAAPALAAPAEHSKGPRSADVGVPTPVEGPQAPPAGESKSRGKAYGRYCRGASRKHGKGQKGTAFSRCVKAMAQLDKVERKSARAACKGLSKEGGRASAFRLCVKAARKLQQDRRAEEEDGASEEEAPEDEEDEAGEDEDSGHEEDGESDE